MKIIPAWLRRCLPWFYQTALQDRCGELSEDKIYFIDKKTLIHTKISIKKIFFYIEQLLLIPFIH